MTTMNKWMMGGVVALLAACGQPKQAPVEEVAMSGNPVFEGWYADPDCSGKQITMLQAASFFETAMILME